MIVTSYHKSPVFFPFKSQFVYQLSRKISLAVVEKRMYQFLISGNKEDMMGSKIHEQENPTCRPTLGRKRNRCVIFPANVSMVAECVERINHSWFVTTEVASDLIIQVGEGSFHLHKLPMVAKSEYLNRLVFKRSCVDTNSNVLIDNLPGGSEIFELVVKFCYGWKVDLTATNIAPLYCAAQFLEMTDGLERGNLISKTETYLSFLIFSSWKDTFRILRSCESISSWARELQILKRCSEAIAWKVCTDPKALNFNENDAEFLFVLPENANELTPRKVVESWWFEDVSFLRIDHFIEVITLVKRKGMRPELVGSCIAHWTERWVSQIKFELGNPTQKDLVLHLQRITIESLIRVLPIEQKSVSFNFLLQLLKLGLTLKIDSELIVQLEKRTAFLLETSRPKDLLVKNYNPSDTYFDVGVIARVLEAYVSLISSKPESRIFVVGRMVDEYLMLVARTKNLHARDFGLLVEALPKSARFCDDNLYRAIDMYLKAHPSLTEEDRSSICRAMEYNKLSLEARKHAMRNHRLPTDISTRFILLEQVNMTRFITAIGSNYQRTKSQAILRVRRGVCRRWINSQKEIKRMKKDVETMKMQLNNLHFCRMDLQRQLKRGII